MFKVQTFDSYEDMVAAMEENRRAADEQVLEEQTAIKPGDFVVREVEDFLVYSEILDPVATADDEERAYIKELYSAPHMKHYRFTKSYSVCCVDGEYGDIHVSTVYPITQEQFERAKEVRWSSDEDSVKYIATGIKA